MSIGGDLAVGALGIGIGSLGWDWREGSMAADGGLDKQSQAIILIEERQSQQWKISPLASLLQASVVFLVDN